MSTSGLSLKATQSDGFYYPPEWDPSQGSLDSYRRKQGFEHALGKDRVKNLDKGVLVVRFELPFKVCCHNCKEFIGQGTRFDADKKKIGMYYTTPIYSFTMHCGQIVDPSVSVNNKTHCNQIWEIHTDPKNCDYKLVSGLSRPMGKSDTRASNDVYQSIQELQQGSNKDSDQESDQDDLRNESGLDQLYLDVDVQRKMKDDPMFRLEVLARREEAENMQLEREIKRKERRIQENLNQNQNLNLKRPREEEFQSESDQESESEQSVEGELERHFAEIDSGDEGGPEEFDQVVDNIINSHKSNLFTGNLNPADCEQNLNSLKRQKKSSTSQLSQSILKGPKEDQLILADGSDDIILKSSNSTKTIKSDGNTVIKPGAVPQSKLSWQRQKELLLEAEEDQRRIDQQRAYSRLNTNQRRRFEDHRLRSLLKYQHERHERDHETNANLRKILREEKKVQAQAAILDSKIRGKPPMLNDAEFDINDPANNLPRSKFGGGLITTSGGGSSSSKALPVTVGQSSSSSSSSSSSGGLITSTSNNVITTVTKSTSIQKPDNALLFEQEQRRRSLMTGSIFSGTKLGAKMDRNKSIGMKNLESKALLFKQCQSQANRDRARKKPK